MEKKNSSSGSGLFWAGLVGAAVGAVGALFASDLLSDKQPTPSKVEQTNTQQGNDQPIEDICCPITSEPMKDPYMICTCGHTFEHSVIFQYLKTSKECPVCRKACKQEDLVPNYALKNVIQQMISQEKKQ